MYWNVRRVEKLSWTQRLKVGTSWPSLGKRLGVWISEVIRTQALGVLLRQASAVSHEDTSRLRSECFLSTFSSLALAVSCLHSKSQLHLHQQMKCFDLNSFVRLLASAWWHICLPCRFIWQPPLLTVWLVPKHEWHNEAVTVKTIPLSLLDWPLN